MLTHARLVEQGHAVAFLPDMLWFDRTPRPALDASAVHVRTVLGTVRAGAGEHPMIRNLLAALGYAVGGLPARTG